MVERLLYLATYVGSAAMVAFMAVCVTSPQVATFNCAATGADGTEQCEVVDPPPVTTQDTDPSKPPGAAMQ